MTASPALLPPISYGQTRYARARSDLPATAGSLAALSEVGQAFADRIGGPLSCQCRPSSVPAAETYSSNPDAVDPPVPWYRCPTVGGWIITADGDDATSADVAGAVCETGELPSTCAWVRGVAWITGTGPAGEIGASATITTEGGTTNPTTSSAVAAARSVYTSADGIGSISYQPTQYSGILIGSGGFPVSTADFVSLAYAQRLALWSSSAGQWVRGVPEPGSFTERGCRVAVSVGGLTGLGPSLLHVQQCATHITRIA